MSRIQKKSVFLSLFLVFLTGICLAVPELQNPPNDARFGQNDGIVVFEWEQTHPLYQIELAVDPEFQVGTGPRNTGNANFFNLSDLVPDDIWFPLTLTLYWRVRGMSNDLVPDDWTEPYCFHKSVLSESVLENGNDGRYTHTTFMPLLTWTNPDQVNRFSLEFALDSSFETTLGTLILTDPFLDFSGIDRTVWDAIEGVFYWRVSPYSSSRVPGPWSNVGRISKTRINPPEILSPADGAFYPPVSEPAVLTWESSNTNECYDIRFYADPEGNDDVFTITHDGSTRFDFADDLQITDDIWHYAAFTLYWAVSGYDRDDRPGPFSVPRELIKPGYHRIATYGDSITDGKCYEDGYINMLHDLLVGVWGNETTSVNIAVPGMKSRWGAENMESRLMGSCPHYVLIMFGTNDSVDPGNCDPPFECDVALHLADMVTIARNRGTIPIISTIIPVNPEGSLAAAQWRVDENNDEIIDMAMQMGVDLVDLNARFWDHGNLPELFCDWGHPNEEGYRIMASGFFDGIMSSPY